MHYRSNVFTNKIVFGLFCIIMIACSSLVKKNNYVNKEFGLGFEYPQDWNLEENSDNIIALEYEANHAVEVGLYLRIESLALDSSQNAQQILENQISKWITQRGTHNFLILEPPKLDGNNSQTAYSTAIIRIPINPVVPDNATNVMTTDFYQESQVIIKEDKFLLITSLYRANPPDSGLKTEVEDILNSFYWFDAS